MGSWTVLLVGIGVADAFAVSLARGLKIRLLQLSQALLIGGAFGLFQAEIIGGVIGIGIGISILVEHLSVWPSAAYPSATDPALLGSSQTPVGPLHLRWASGRPERRQAGPGTPVANSA